MTMKTVQLRLTKELLRKCNEILKKGEYPNRSELIRDAVREFVDKRVI